MGDEQLCIIAHELLERSRAMSPLTGAKGIRQGQDPGAGEAHPEEVRLSPDLAKAATKLVLEQAEVLCDAWG